MSNTIAIHPSIHIDCDRLRKLCQHWQIIELALFGSVLREDFRPDSDIDLLITWDAQSHWTLLDFAQMHEDFALLLDRPVDLVSKRAIESSNNPLRRKEILNTAQLIYQK
ncbi:nucleotidyltransferase domain-containing protein [Roseofilum reptotaenium CS-1145]|uniref:Nucleotidyltransferase n=1 Tax=Roseofilum reptotaenium AO1-A TaxID=1925591 RepID=A0A1L9QPJ5_9CYAN|nr:nucleotidyltransferase domain-containing protein [Roseofilum reptotaenium]MDB9515808.1 nucleotidyltransferase domain-containing protein [Roseofilum reptotaenium CS-1145]OJJ24593.1 nucleotidyltransferase [Roseofilum reptotaenium AO1-A]